MVVATTNLNLFFYLSLSLFLSIPENGTGRIFQLETHFHFHSGMATKLGLSRKGYKIQIGARERNVMIASFSPSLFGFDAGRAF